MSTGQAHSLIQAGLAQHKQGQLARAAQCYNEALRHEPRNGVALQLLGIVRAQTGQIDDAIALLHQALEVKPGDPGVLLNLGTSLDTAKRHDEALAVYDQALAQKPDFFEALYNRGVALIQLSRHEEAIAAFDRALGLRADAVCHFNRGIALEALMRLDEALDNYEQAIALEPQLGSAHDNRGVILRRLARHDEALVEHNAVLRMTPNDARALHNRGKTLLVMRRFDEALADLERSPQNADTLNDCGVALWHLRRFAASLKSYDEALRDRPGNPVVLMNRGRLLLDMHRPQAALADFESAGAHEAYDAQAWNGRGAALQMLKRGSDALAAFDRALEIDPILADALENRGLLRWSHATDAVGACADLEKALALDSERPFLGGELALIRMYVGDWQDRDATKAMLDDGVRAGKPVVRPFAYQGLSASPADLQACARIFTKRFGPTASTSRKPDGDRNRKIRIGYVSGEFREQATAYLMAGLYERHDRTRFDIVAIDNGVPDASATRRRLEQAFDRVISIANLSDDQAAGQIAAGGIDILVNLNGYFGIPRMGVFTRRPAPLQVNYLGFPGTLGAPCMDYIFADRIVIPADEEQFYDECVVCLPNTYQVNDDKRPIGPRPGRAQAGLPETGTVFCSFNQSYKFSPEGFRGWMRILAKVEGSVLWLMQGPAPLAENLRRDATACGISADRLIFATSLPQDAHLARLGLADLFLDCLPYNAHTTASDALWAGVPVLTRIGTAFAGRVSTSLLRAMDLDELVTRSQQDFEHLAINLASHPAALHALRKRVEENRGRCALFDTDLFRKNIEAAYSAIWERWQQGKAPSGLVMCPDRSGRHATP